MDYIGFILICMVLSYFTFAAVVGGLLSIVISGKVGDKLFFLVATLIILALWFVTFYNAPFTITIGGN